MNYIHLRHYHNDVQQFNHPLLDGCRKYSEEELRTMVSEGRLDLLVLRHRVSLLIGRYLAAWPTTRRHLDDMVSEAMLAVLQLFDGPPIDILSAVTNRAQNAIEKMLNRQQAMSAASATTQKYRISQNLAPVYLHAESSEYSEASHPVDSGDEWKRDYLESFDEIAQDDLDRAILKRCNWGVSHSELAGDLGVSVATISRRKKRLYTRLKELG